MAVLMRKGGNIYIGFPCNGIDSIVTRYTNGWEPNVTMVCLIWTDREARQTRRGKEGVREANVLVGVAVDALKGEQNARGTKHKYEKDGAPSTNHQANSAAGKHKHPFRGRIRSRSQRNAF